MAIKRDVAEKLMSEKGNLIKSQQCGPGTASGRLGGALFLRGKRYQRGLQRLVGCDKQPAAQFVCP